MSTKIVQVAGQSVPVAAKPWYQSKQLWLAIATSIGGIVAALVSEYPTVGIFVTLKGIFDFIIRYNTFTAIE